MNVNCLHKMQTRDIFFMKLFRTSSTEIVQYCQTVFGCELPIVLLLNGMRNLLRNLHVHLFSCVYS